MSCQCSFDHSTHGIEGFGQAVSISAWGKGCEGLLGHANGRSAQVSYRRDVRDVLGKELIREGAELPEIVRVDVERQSWKKEKRRRSLRIDAFQFLCWSFLISFGSVAPETPNTLPDKRR